MSRCIVLLNKCIKIHSVAWVMPYGTWGAGVKRFNVEICDGAQSTACFSVNLEEFRTFLILLQFESAEKSKYLFLNLFAKSSIAATNISTVNVKKFRTLDVCKKKTRQTAQTQIRVVLKKQSDQGLLCLLFREAVCGVQS